MSPDCVLPIAERKYARAAATAFQLATIEAFASPCSEALAGTRCLSFSLGQTARPGSEVAPRPAASDCGANLCST
jgi:hypothetical protein